MILHDSQNYSVLDIHSHFAGDITRFDPTIAIIFEKLQAKQSFSQRHVGRDPGALLDYLDSEGVDQVCILAEEGPPTNYSVDSGFCCGYAAQAPDRIFAIGNVNPRIETNVGRRCQQLVCAGVRGFKIYGSDHNVDPFDRRLSPLYEVCNERHLPVLFHSGTASRYPMTNPRFGEPLYFEPLFARYPQIPFVMCHGGKGGQHLECLRLVRDYPNTFIDISDMPGAILAQVCSDDLADRFVFGSDMPQFLGYSNLLRRVLDLALSADSKRKMLYDNGAKLLGLRCSNASSAAPVAH